MQYYSTATSQQVCGQKPSPWPTTYMLEVAPHRITAWLYTRNSLEENQKLVTYDLSDAKPTKHFQPPTEASLSLTLIYCLCLAMCMTVWLSGFSGIHAGGRRSRRLMSPSSKLPRQLNSSSSLAPQYVNLVSQMEVLAIRRVDMDSCLEWTWARPK